MMYGLSGCAWSGGCARELAKHSADREQADRAQEGLGVWGETGGNVAGWSSSSEDLGELSTVLPISFSS